METTMDIDRALKKQAWRLLAIRPKKKPSRLGLLIALEQQARIKSFRGKLKWEGDLDEMGSEASFPRSKGNSAEFP